ncbi:MAG: type II secretion system protein [Planctomycetota bacterium]
MKKGFTLIELLVVMGIIAILAALLVPVFQQAREKAKQTRCMNRLKQIGGALNAYQGDTGSLPEYNNMQDVKWTDMRWEESGRRSRRMVQGTMVNRRGSLDLLVPNYLSDVRMLKCPSDEGSPELALEGQPGEQGRASNPTLGIDMDAALSRDIKIENHYGNDYYWGACDPFENPESRACTYVGLQRADHISYVYTGEQSISSSERQKPSRMRIMADNDEEGNEKPFGEFPMMSEMSSGTVNWRPDFQPGSDAGGSECRGNVPTGLIHYRGYSPFSDVPEYASWAAQDLGISYYYVGGLESSDNHGTNGVNVLYLDWHVDFDQRSWPAPIGWKNTTRFPRQRWTVGDGSAMAGCENTTYLPAVRRSSEQIE